MIYQQSLFRQTQKSWFTLLFTGVELDESDFSIVTLFSNNLQVFLQNRTKSLRRDSNVFVETNVKVSKNILPNQSLIQILILIFEWMKGLGVLMVIVLYIIMPFDYNTRRD